MDKIKLLASGVLATVMSVTPAAARVVLGFTFGGGAPLYYYPPPAYYYPPPVYYPPPPQYYPAPAYEQPPPYDPSYDPNNCGTPDEPQPCPR